MEVLQGNTHERVDTSAYLELLQVVLAEVLDGSRHLRRRLRQDRRRKLHKRHTLASANSPKLIGTLDTGHIIVTPGYGDLTLTSAAIPVSGRGFAIGFAWWSHLQGGFKGLRHHGGGASRLQDEAVVHVVRPHVRLDMREVLQHHS